VLLDCQDAGGMRLPLNLEARGFDDCDHRVCHFRADAVAGDESDGVFHVGLPAAYGSGGLAVERAAKSRRA
jgi:hypothetical protein